MNEHTIKATVRDMVLFDLAIEPGQDFEIWTERVLDKLAHWVNFMAEHGYERVQVGSLLDGGKQLYYAVGVRSAAGRARAEEKNQALQQEYDTRRAERRRCGQIADRVFAGLEIRTRHCLASAGYLSVEAIRSASDDALLAISGFGPWRLAEVRRVYPFDGSRE